MVDSAKPERRGGAADFRLRVVVGRRSRWRRAAALSLGTLLALGLPLCASEAPLSALAVDLNDATVVVPANLSAPAQKALELLGDEVAVRTGRRWPVGSATEDSARP